MRSTLIQLLFVSAGILFIAIPQAQAQQNAGSGERYPAVTLASTEVRTLFSESVEGMEYKIFIGLPDGYATSSETYPALYFLDAWDQFGILVETYRLLRWFNEIPPLVLVGISWEGDAQDHLYFRSRDYIPTYVSPQHLAEQFGQGLANLIPASGGASNFLGFIQTELMPLIEQEYRVDPSDRGIFGYSAGGIFTSWVLFRNPELFQKYLIGSGALWWDDDLVFKLEEEFNETHDSLNVKVLATVGSEEGEMLVTSWAKIKDRLQSRHYEGLEFTTSMFEGETHTSGIPVTYSRALRVLYGH